MLVQVRVSVSVTVTIDGASSASIPEAIASGSMSSVKSTTVPSVESLLPDPVVSTRSPVPARSDVTSLRPKVGRDRRHLERIVELVAKGAVKIPEIKVYKLSEAAEAHRVSEGRHLRGKLVFKVR